MITITKNGNAVLFEFEENQHYLYNGTIEVPLNSLSLVTDESEMFTFKKAATNDIFISARYDDVNMSKSQLIDFYIANMVGSGNSESGITSGDVQTMIDTSLEDYYDIDEIDAALSGKADSSAVTESINAAVSGKQDTLIAGSGITISGNVISAEGGNLVIELTQAEYDALVDKDPNAFYIITDATEINISDYYTKSEVDTALSGKQDTLIAGTNIKTINNESILGSGNIDIQGGGGKAIVAGRGIEVTTGETADTVSFNLPISAGTGNHSIIVSDTRNKATGNYSFAGGQSSSATSFWTFALGGACRAAASAAVSFGNLTQALGGYSFTVGERTIASKDCSSAIGSNTRAKNVNEFSCGVFNNSVSASTAFGNSGNTLFSVGNGTAENTRHNAFEIRQNGDIYLTKDGQDVKLQDQLGGGSITIDPSLDSGSTNAVANSAITSQFNSIDARISEDEEVTAAALNALNDGKQDTLIAGSGITISGNVISAIGGGGGIDSGTVQTMIDDSISGKADTSAVTVAINSAVSGKADSSAVTEISSAVSGKMDTSVFNTYSAATNARMSEDEEVTAAALNALNDRVDAIDITVDDALDATSENPVQNKVIYAVIGDIESLLSNI